MRTVRSDDVLDRPAPGPDAVLRYADPPDGVVEVFLPLSLGRPPQPAPLVVLIHGGFWRQAYDRAHLRPLAVAIRNEGYVVALPEYRRVGGAGGWPTTGSDVEAALTRLPALLEAAAPGYAETAAPCVVAGHSAGGHLALWAGLRAGAERVRHVVALAPVADLAEAARQRLGGDAVQALLGGEPPDVPPAYTDADPLHLLADAVRFPSSRTPRVTVIQGSADEQVPAGANRRIAELAGEAAGTADPVIRYVGLDGVDHFALIDPLSAVYDDVLLPALAAG